MSASTDGSVDGDGSRVLSIQLPNGKTVEATVDTSMRMMDLVISIASHNGLNPTAYQIAQPSKYKGRPPNVYTPSQSAGDIVGNSIMLVPKKEREQFSINKGKKSGVFEHTVRLTIHSSKNHKMVFRTNPEKRLEEVFPKICEDRGVDPSQYVMRAHKQKVDADQSKTIASFNTLDFDLVEADSENKRKSGLFGKFKKKEDEEEKTEKVKTLPPTSNGAHLKQEQGQEQKHHMQTPLDTGTQHKKRPAPRPPSAVLEPNGVQPQVVTSEKSAPKMSRVSTKKRRAPPVPGVIVPISIDDPPKEEPSVEIPRDETDAPVVSDAGQEREAPSPTASRSSSRDKDSIASGSLGEQENSGSAPSKPPRLNIYSNGINDVNLDSKPVFVPPSPPPTPPSASVPRQDIMKLIAEGRLSVEEDVDGLNNNSENGNISPDRLSARDDGVEVEFSAKEDKGDSGDVVRQDDGGDVTGDNIDVTVVKSASEHAERSDSVPENGKGDPGDDLAITGTSDPDDTVDGSLQTDAPPLDSSSPPSEDPGPSVDNVSRTSVDSEKASTGPENASGSVEDGHVEGQREEASKEETISPVEGSHDDTTTDEVDGGDPPKSEAASPKVCKCVDPENGEECSPSCSPPLSESGQEDGTGSSLPGSVSTADVSEKSGGDKDDSTSDITGEAPVEPTSQSSIKDVTLQVSVDTETIPRENPDSLPKDKPKPVTSPKPYILPKPKRFVIRQDNPHPLGSRLSLYDENDNESEVAKLRPFDPNKRKSFFQSISFESNTEISDDKSKDTGLSLGSEMEISDSDKSISLSQGEDSLPTMSHTMDEESNDTTSYSAVPQEEDFTHQMEDKSLQMTAGTQGLTKEGTDSSKSNSTGKVTYQMQTEAVPEDVHDLKEMYQQMQKQLIDLQQTILSQQQQQPANQGAAFQQLQQLQQQMLLQQALLSQQGMVPQSMMMMPQPAPMVLQMGPQGVVVPPYMVPPQQQMMVMQQSQTSPAAAQQAVDGVPSGPSNAQSVVNKGEETTKVDGANLVPDGKVWDTGEPTSSENATTAGTSGKESKSASAEPQSASNGVKESETPASKSSPTLPKSSALKEDSKVSSPSSRRKNVFADIIKKKGRPTSNYVLSAQREMLNRQRSNSDAKTSPSQANTRSKVESDLSSKDSKDTKPESKKDIRESDEQVAVGAKKSEETEIDATKTSSADEKKKTDASLPSVGKVNNVPASSGLMNSTDDSKSQPTNIVKESEAKVEQVLSSPSPRVEESRDEVKEILAPPPLVGKETETMDNQELNAPPSTNSSREKEISKQSNEQLATTVPPKDTTEVMERETETTVKSSPSEDKNLKVTSFEAQFADKSSSGVQQGGGDATAHAPPKVAPKPARKPVGKPQNTEAARPFRKSSRPVTLASDRQVELQKMASLSNVSRFKEMMEALKSKEATD